MQTWKGTLTTTAAFAELAIPLGDLIEVNVAGRYEEFDEIGEDSVDPKISVIFRPTDSLTLRAPAGSRSAYHHCSSLWCAQYGSKPS